MRGRPSLASSESRNTPHCEAVQTITGAGISPLCFHRSTRASVHSSGRTFRAPRLPPGLTLAAGLCGSVCGTVSDSALRATAWIRLMRASDSGRDEIRLPSRSLRAFEQAAQQIAWSSSCPGRLISRIAAYRSRKW